MTASQSAHHDSYLRFDLVKSLADHLLQYPQDLVDAKRLIKSFRVSIHEFQQALLSSQQEGQRDTSCPVPPTSSVRPEVVKSLTGYLLQYPQDIVDIKRLIKRFRVSAEEFHQALLSLDSRSYEN